MNQRIKESDLKLGVELEGAFSRKLADLVWKNDWGNFSGDGSVNLYDLSGKIIEAGQSPIEYAEFKSTATDFKTLKEVLAGFKFPHYATDSSCGLHCHISCSKVKFRDLSFLVSDLDFLRGIKTMAIKKFGAQQVRRLKDNRTIHYYSDYNSVEDLDCGIEESHKYKFVRFHNVYGTLEFRFLYPYCNDPELNIKNIQLLLGKVIDRINGRTALKFPVFMPEISQKVEKLPELNYLLSI